MNDHDGLPAQGEPLTPLSASHIAAFETMLGADAVKHEQIDTLMDVGINAGNLGAGVVLMPSTVQQVCALTRYCREHAIGIGKRRAVSHPIPVVIEFDRRVV